MPSRLGPESVIQIDCHYVQPERVAAYLIVEGDRAAFVDNNTVHAVPRLLQALGDAGLRPEQVDYAIVTHVHLDHCGGTAELLKQCPNAVALAHPRAVRHLIDPARLVASATMVYGGPVFDALYGVIEPIDAARARAMDDGETLRFGTRTLTFPHTRGHANHHFCIHDSASRGVFTGDSFGIAYPSLQYGRGPLITCSSPPTEFEPDEARVSVDKIMAFAPERVYLSHFGVFENVAELATELLASIGQMDTILRNTTALDHTGEELRGWCEDRVRGAVYEAARAHGLDLNEAERKLLEFDIVINAKGIAYAAARRRRPTAQPKAATPQY